MILMIFLVGKGHMNNTNGFSKNYLMLFVLVNVFTAQAASSKSILDIYLFLQTSCFSLSCVCKAGLCKLNKRKSNKIFYPLSASVQQSLNFSGS